MNPTCDTCRFWNPEEAEVFWGGEKITSRMVTKDGECHRYPPKHAESWPIAHPKDFCGEHQPKAAPPSVATPTLPMCDECKIVQASVFFGIHGHAARLLCPPCAYADALNAQRNPTEAQP